MKKGIAIFLLAAVMLTLAACGNKAAPATEPETQPETTQATEAATQPTQATEAATQPTEAPTQPTQPAAPLEYTGIYWRTWNEEIGGILAAHNSYYVLNADHTGYVVAQAVGTLTWNENQVTDNLGQTYRIVLTQENGNLNLQVYDFPGNPSVYQKITKLPAEIEAMIAEVNRPTTPTTPTVSAPRVTKDPTSESVTEGGTAYFVARGENYSTINWYIVSADRSSRMSVNNASWNFPGLAVSGEGSTTLQLANIPLSMNGWYIEAVFTGEGGTATTKACFVNVNKPASTPLYAVPSSGIFVNNQTVQLTAAPGNTIYYELSDEVGFTTTGTIQSGGYITIPVVANCRYIARLVAYVVGDQNNLTVCEYTMDGIPEVATEPGFVAPEALGPDTYNGNVAPEALGPDAATEYVAPEALGPAQSPAFNGGHFYNNNDAELYLDPIGDGGFSADLGVLRVVSFTGSGTYHSGTVLLDLKDPNGGFVGGEFDVASGTLTISTSSWPEVPAGTTFYGLR